MTTETKRINLLSGPRNISTALMYSFARRGDTSVKDEPLYGHYLRVSGVQHPGREETMRLMDCDGARVIRDCILGPCATPILFLKNMAHHLVEIDESFLAKVENIFLIRDPRRILRSYARVISHPQMADIGIDIQLRLFRRLSTGGAAPPVLDSTAVLRNPAGVLAQLCERLAIPFDAAMLHWPSGPRAEDGNWARYWYAGVHNSTGFGPPETDTCELPPHLEELAAQAAPLYRELAAYAIRA